RDAVSRAAVIRIFRVVDTGEIDEIVPAVGFERAGDVGDLLLINDERDLAGEFFRADNRAVHARDRARDERAGSDLVDTSPWRRGGLWRWRVRSLGHLRYAPSYSLPACSINVLSMSSVSASPGVQSEMSFVSPSAIAFA